MKKRLLASLLSLCLIVGLLPTAALAADESGTEGEMPAVCTCTALCAEGSVDATCPVCAEDYNSCAYEEAPAEPAEEPGDEPVEEPTEGPAGEPEGPVCAGLEGCDGDTHAEGCPLYVEPEEPADAQDGDKNTYYETDDVTAPVGPTALNPLADDGMSGNCGAEGNESNVTWKLEQNNQDSENPTYTLTISGSGAMANYNVDTSNQSTNGYYKVTDSPWLNYADKITKIDLSTSITKIGKGAFNSCAITELPWSGKEAQYSALTEIEQFAFAGCTALTEVTFVPTVTTYGNYAFEGCTDLTSIDWTNYRPSAESSDKLSVNGVLVATGLFAECSSLTSDFVLPEQIIGIDRAAFRNTGYTAIDFTTDAPGVKVIEEQAFSGSKLASITLPSADAHPDTKFGVSAFSGTEVTTISIPYYSQSDNANVSEQMFKDCDSLSSVVLDDGITSIGKNAFSGTAITTINWPTSLTTIGDYAFNGAKFNSLDIPSNITTIGGQAFYSNTQLKSVTLRATSVSLGYGAFAQCSALETIDLSRVNTVTLTTTGSNKGNVFTRIKDGSALYVRNYSVIPQPEAGSATQAMLCSNYNTAVLVIGEATVDVTKTGFEAVSRNGYTAKWYKNSDFSGESVSEIAKTESNNRVYPVYYAKWVREITFNANGGEGSMNAQQVTEGDTSTTLTANSFTKTGYTFSGWNTAADGTGTSYADQATAPTTSTTLYAQWTPNTYTINFNGGTGASGSTASVTATYDQPATLTANGFTKSGYNFAGWSQTENGTTVDFSDGAQVENLTETANGTVTLYAVWTTKTVLAPDVTAQTKTYNGTEQSFTLDGSYTIAYQRDGQTATPKDAGIYDVVISSEETESTAAYKNTVYGGLIIDPAPLTITADNKSIYVGGALPEYTYTVSGLVDGDTLATTPTVTCADADANTAGTYTITASDADAGKNYTITYVNGTLTVSRRSSGGGGGSSSGSTGNVTGSGDDVNIDVSGGSVTTAQMEKAVDKADRGETITIEASSRSSVSLPSSGLQDAADNNNDVTVELKNGEVTLSPEALSAVAEQAGTTVTLTVDPVDTDELNSRQQVAVGDAPVFDLTLKSGGKTITDFDGGLVTVAIPYELPDDQDPAGVVVWFMDDNGNITACETMYDLRTETVIFTTRHFSKYVIGYEEPMNFTDVPADAYYADAVKWAVAEGITEGTSATTFSPDMSCTRAQMVTFLWRAAGSPEATGSNPFTDVSTSAYYYDAVLWAVKQGITSGTSATTFSPDAVVSRGQTVTFLWRQAGAPVVNYAMSFADVDADAYYAEAVRWAVSEGVTSGTGAATFSPDNACTRAQIVTFMYRAEQ